MKVLLFDIETSPEIGAYFDRYRENNIIWTDQSWYMMSFSYKWLGQKTTYVKGLPDYPSYEKEPTNDLHLVSELWELFNEADIIIGHNGDRFDIRKTNARFISHGLLPPSPSKTIDTLKVAKKYYKFESNRLDAIGEQLGLGRKLQTGGYQLWKDCMNGDLKAWAKMKRYNKQDVILLEQVYMVFAPWMHNHMATQAIDEDTPRCQNPNCHSKNLQKRGWEQTNSGLSKYQRYYCKDCGKWGRGRTVSNVREIR